MGSKSLLNHKQPYNSTQQESVKASRPLWDPIGIPIRVWQEVPLEPTPGTAKNRQSLVSGGHLYGKSRARQALKRLAVQPCIETIALKHIFQRIQAFSRSCGYASYFIRIFPHISGSNPPWFRVVYLFRKGSPWITLFIEQLRSEKRQAQQKH